MNNKFNNLNMADDINKSLMRNKNEIILFSSDSDDNVSIAASNSQEKLFNNKNAMNISPRRRENVRSPGLRKRTKFSYPQKKAVNNINLEMNSPTLKNQNLTLDDPKMEGTGAKSIETEEQQPILFQMSKAKSPSADELKTREYSPHVPFKRNFRKNPTSPQSKQQLNSQNQQKLNNQNLLPINPENKNKNFAEFHTKSKTNLAISNASSITYYIEAVYVEEIKGKIIEYINDENLNLWENTGVISHQKPTRINSNLDKQNNVEKSTSTENFSANSILGSNNDLRTSNISDFNRLSTFKKIPTFHINNEESESLKSDADFASQMKFINNCVFDSANDSKLGEYVRTNFEDSKYNLTTIMEPSNSEVNILPIPQYSHFMDIKTFTVIKSTPFIEFKFGSKVIDEYPDLFHIFTWHNIGITPNIIAISLKKFVECIQNNEIELDKLECATQYILYWIVCFPEDFYGNYKDCARIVDDILKLILKRSKDPNTKKSKISAKVNLCRSFIKSLYEKNKSPQSFTIPIQKPTFDNMLYKGITLINEMIEPGQIVQHLTYIECKIFNQIQRKDFLMKNYQNIAENPHYKELYERHNKTTSFIATYILSRGNAKDRAAHMLYWIKVMEEARKQRNYNLLFEIDAALSSKPIYRLRKTREMIKTYLEGTYKQLHALTSPTQSNVAAYKKEIFQESTSKTLPYIGWFSTDIKRTIERYKIAKLEGNDINLTFQKEYYDNFSQIFQDWGTKMSFHLNKELLELCEKLEGGAESTDDLMDLSEKLEP